MNSSSFENSDDPLLGFMECLRGGISNNYLEALKYAKDIQLPCRSFILGVVYMQQWEDGCAREEFKHFIRLNPRSTGALCNLAICSEESEKDPSKILSLFESALESALDHPLNCRLNAMTLAKCLVNVEKMIFDADSQERRRSWLLKEKAKLLLLDTIRGLMERERLSEEWLMNYGGVPKIVKRWVEGPIDAHKHEFLKFGEAIMAESLEAISFIDLYSMLERWVHLVKFSRDSTYELHASRGETAKFPQRDCCIKP